MLDEDSIAEQLKKEIKKDDRNISDDDIENLMENAKLVILNVRYPFQDFPTDETTGEYVLEGRYYSLWYRIAMEMYSKQGVEGQTSHTENGVTRNFASAGVSSALLKEITPKGGVL